MISELADELERTLFVAQNTLEKMEQAKVEWIREGWNARRARHAG
jgi:hypothetical protein